MSLSVITAVDSKYWFFAGSFVYFLQKSNPNVRILLWVDNTETINKISPEINWCINTIGANVDLKLYPNDTIETGRRSRSIRGDDIRFVAMPPDYILETDYCAVTDSDIIYLTEIEADIESKMTLANNIYLGLQRDNKANRITGTFYNKPSEFYPKCKNQMKIHRKNKKNYGGDECLLYEIMHNSGIKIDNTNQCRPIYGIHASMNREPYAKNINWGIRDWHIETYKKYLSESDFENIMNSMYKERVHNRLFT